MRDLFNSRATGRGTTKWDHYFDAYHRHFSRFVGKDVNVLEVGVWSGGSLDLWKDYFGPGCRAYGVDIDPACKKYEDDRTKIFTGDQTDRSFWAGVRAEAPRIDILIDDGGHETEQQIVTLEEMLPHLRPGGVYLCEDVLDSHNAFPGYVQGLIAALEARRADADEVPASSFQSSIASVHCYPYVFVIEKACRPVAGFSSRRRGSEWNL